MAAIDRPTTLLGRLIRRVRRSATELTWSILAAALALHVGMSWLALIIFGEGDIASASVFPYYYLTTATTVGYGDFSPATTGARNIAAFWIMPGAVLLFTAVIGKIIQAITDRWTKAMKGREDYSDLEGHVVVFGWQGDRTRRLMDLLLAEDEAAAKGIVLVSQVLEDNPMPDRISFIRVDALSSTGAVQRSGVAQAEVALIVGADDDTTLAAALAVGALPNPPRIIAYFQTSGPAALLRSYCPTAEAQESLSTELMARSACDPGAARLQQMMLSSLEGPTQYSFIVPEGIAATDCAKALTALKRSCNATLLGLSAKGSDDLHMNPTSDTPINAGDRLYYIAARRLEQAEIAEALG